MIFGFRPAKTAKLDGTNGLNTTRQIVVDLSLPDWVPESMVVALWFCFGW